MSLKTLYTAKWEYSNQPGISICDEVYYIYQHVNFSLPENSQHDDGHHGRY